MRMQSVCSALICLNDAKHVDGRSSNKLVEMHDFRSPKAERIQSETTELNPILQSFFLFPEDRVASHELLS